MSNKFNRSLWLKKRHSIAKKQRNYFKSNFQDSRFKYSDFLRNDNPLSEKIIAYDVSYQVSYRGNTDNIIIKPQTFTVFGFDSDESEIKNRTMNMILDSRGKETNHQLHPKTIQAIEMSTDIKIDKIKPRGIEPSVRKPSYEDINNILENRFSVKNLDNKVKIINKKKREGVLELDIRHFT